MFDSDFVLFGEKKIKNQYSMYNKVTFYKTNDNIM